MKCPECGATIPDHFLACPVCASVRSFRELVARQRDYLPQVTAGRYELHLAQVPGGKRHILLFGSERRMYCGEDFNHHKRMYCALDRMPPGVCARCLDKLTEAIEEVKRTV